MKRFKEIRNVGYDYGIFGYDYGVLEEKIVYDCFVLHIQVLGVVASNIIYHGKSKEMMSV